MRKHINTLYAVLIVSIASILFTSCGGTSSSGGIEIGANGIGDIRFGGKISELPKQSDGLYDNVIVETLGDAGYDEHTLYTFTLDGVPTVKIADYSQSGTVSNIELVAPIADINGISTGMAARDLLQREGVVQVFYNDGGFFFETKECLIAINEFSKSGSSKLDQAYMTGENVVLVADDFTGNSVVKSIKFQAGDETVSLAGNQPDASSNDIDWVEIGLLIVLIAIYVAMSVHMYKVNESKKEQRVFTGSKWRMFWFAGLMTFGFFIEGFNISSLVAILIVAPIVLWVYYYACLTPMTLIAKRGISKNAFHWIGGLWASIENRKANEALITKYEEEMKRKEDHLFHERRRLTDDDKMRMKSKINALESDIIEEKSGLGEAAVKIMLMGIIAIVFVYLTPLSAIGSYMKNYLFYKKKKEASENVILNGLESL